MMQSPPPAPAPCIRLDKWLWQARFFKSRSIAAQAVKGGKIRINRRKPQRASANVRVGDGLTIIRGTQVVVLKIAALGTRRGPASEAQLLYTMLDKTEKSSGHLTSQNSSPNG
jgi:ribosome-associated heat shock protein Hsp15